jgi:hypothetical protein
MEQPQWSKVTSIDHQGELSSGSLLIIWEDVSYSSVPLCGLGVYQGEKVWFLAFNFDVNNPKESKDTTMYVLYKLSADSQKLVEDEHTRFIEEVGHIKDYGEKFDIKTRVKDGQSKFKRSYDVQDLETIIVARIVYDQILNPYPYIVVEE